MLCHGEDTVIISLQTTFQSARTHAKMLRMFRLARTCPWRGTAEHRRCSRNSRKRRASLSTPRKPNFRERRLVEDQEKGTCCSSQTRSHRSPGRARPRAARCSEIGRDKLQKQLQTNSIFFEKVGFHRFSRRRLTVPRRYFPPGRKIFNIRQGQVLQFLQLQVFFC